MILKRFYNEKLAHASYLVGCPAAGEACVIDPNRDIGQYLAGAEGMRIVAVTETHIHADYVSGCRELAEATGARLYLSDEGPPEWKYAFADQPNVTRVREGDSIRVGGVRLDVIRTPGHTPEHIAFVLTDEPTSPDPVAAFTGDFIFVGDVGRPDLLERAAGFEGTMEAGAKVLYESLQRFRGAFDDALLLWPGHGAGSACGKALGGAPVTSLGYEKKANWALRAVAEGSFVAEVLSGQPDPPAYFKEMKRINREGPAILGGFRVPARLEGSGIGGALASGATVIDTRTDTDVAAGFTPGTINIPPWKSFIKWAGWLTPYDRPIYLVASDEESAARAARDLALIGLDDVRGWFPAAELENPATVPQARLHEGLEKARTGEATLLDVRNQSEWDEGHLPGAVLIPLGHLAARAGELDRSKPIVTHCQAGERSAIAAVLLRKLGFAEVADMQDGYAAYQG